MIQARSEVLPGHGQISEWLGGREPAEGEQGPLEEVRAHRGPAGGVVQTAHQAQSNLQDGSGPGELEHGVGHHVTHQQLILSIVLVTT